jgi:hypothetical protein
MVSEVMYKTWIPQVLIAHHQQWMTGARLFVPPYSDPVNPNIDALLWREIEVVGSAMHLNLQEAGARGVLHGASFPGWWEGADCMTPLWHNVVGILTEAAACRLASPVYVDPTELGAWGTGFPKYTRLSNFPDPWPGGWWRLRDIMDYDMACLVGALEACSRNKETILANFHRMSAAAIEKGGADKPFAFVLPPSGDQFSLGRMIERLIIGGVEVHQATADFEVGERTLPAGSYVIFLAQPYRAYAKDMLERQYYPEIRVAPEAPPLESYDATAWTMALKMGLECVEASAPFEVQVKPVARVEIPVTTVPPAQGGYLTLDRASLGAYAFVNRAIKARLDVHTITDTLRAGSRVIAPGTFAIPLGRNPEAVRGKVLELAAGLSLAFGSVQTADARLLSPLRPVRIGVFAPHLENEAFGWLKYVLEDFGFDYRVLRNEDIKRGYLSKISDVVIFHDADPGIIKDGKPSGWWAEFFEPYPPEYSGGIGDDGIKALKAFLEEGGVIIATAGSCDFALSSLELPAKDILKDVKEKDFTCPGAILALRVDPHGPITWGIDATTPCFFFYSTAFSTRIPYGKFGRQVVATYADRDLLLSGYIRGEDMIKGKPALVSLGYGKGEVILSGFDPIHRAQTYSTYRILFNAILSAGL